MAIEFPGWEQTFERVFVYEKIVGDGLAKRQNSTRVLVVIPSYNYIFIKRVTKIKHSYFYNISDTLQIHSILL